MPEHSNHTLSRLGCKVRLPSSPFCLLLWLISKTKYKGKSDTQFKRIATVESQQKLTCLIFKR